MNNLCNVLQRPLKKMNTLVEIFSLLLLVASVNGGICLPGDCRNIQFEHHTVDKILVNNTIRTVTVNNNDICEIFCYKEPNCVSYNCGPEDSELKQCDLNNRSHRQASNTDFIMKEGYIYRSVLNHCENSSCPINAQCQVGYTMKKYRCVCPSGFEGEHCEIAVREPVALYPLNSAYGTKDMMGNQPDGIPSNVQLADGPDGECEGSHQFLGTQNSFITLPNLGGLDVQYSLTVLMWVYPQGQDGPLFNYRPSGDWEVHFWIVNGKFFSRMAERGGPLFRYLLSPTPLMIGRWAYVATSYDYNTGITRMWVDGIEVAQLDIGFHSMATNYDVRIGVKSGDGRQFKGRVSRVQVYDVALTLEQVLAVQNRGKSS